MPLSALSLSLLGEIEAVASNRDGEGERLPWLFPARNRQGAITPTAVNHALYRTRDRLGLGDFTPHDLRRTAASYMTSMGITRVVVGKILNHAEPGVTATYDRHAYDAEKRHALDAWGAHLQQLVSGEHAAGGKVVSLQDARREGIS